MRQIRLGAHVVVAVLGACAAAGVALVLTKFWTVFDTVPCRAVCLSLRLRYVRLLPSIVWSQLILEFASVQWSPTIHLDARPALLDMPHCRDSAI
jgi:predicted anti-sigma-YlaC factor YlaD